MFGAADVKRITCDSGTKGRYVKISLPGVRKILAMAEVEVYSSTAPGKHSNLINEMVSVFIRHFAITTGTVQNVVETCVVSVLN